MASNEGPGHASLSLLRRAEALVRALAGVDDARVDADAEGRLNAVHVVPSASAQTKAVVRNVQSALRAALNIAIDTRSIFVAPSLPQPLLETVTPEPAIESVMRDGARAQPAPRRLPALANGAVYTNGYGKAPHVELLELQRLGQDQLQCRVVIEANGRRRTGSADAGEEREGAVTLAARATLDALRHMGTGEWLFEGAADVIIGGQRHVVVSIKKELMIEPVSGAAPVHESVEHAVALAVLNAAGPSAFNQNDPERRTASTQRR